MRAEILILDAMGVLYQAGDDVAELLVPFVRHHGRTDLPARRSNENTFQRALAARTRLLFGGGSASIRRWRTIILPAIG